MSRFNGGTTPSNGGWLPTWTAQWQFGVARAVEQCLGSVDTYVIRQGESITAARGLALGTLRIQAGAGSTTLAPDV